MTCNPYLGAEYNNLFNYGHQPMKRESLASKPVNADIKPSSVDERADALATVALTIVATSAMIFWLLGL